MLLERSERESVVQAFRAGCNGVFCHTQSVKDLAKCLDRVHGGQIWANSQELTFVLNALREPRPLRAIETDGSVPSHRTSWPRCAAWPLD
jgi:DNA-binding NarL/FixJ family response regulator